MRDLILRFCITTILIAGPLCCAHAQDRADQVRLILPAAEGMEGAYVPVRFRSRITELGVFELFCVGVQSEEEWKLEFSVREDAESFGG